MSNNTDILKEYKKISLLGKGNYGSVYKVQHIKTKQYFAMKTISTFSCEKSSQTNFTLLDSIENEIKILSQLNHPNITKLHCYFKSESTIYIIMELCDLGDLSSLIDMKRTKKQFFDEKEITTIMSQILNGLNYLHSNNIIHRDIKTLNIFLNHNNTVKIGDFGVSKQLQQNALATTVVGTPYYLSPEICSGQKYNDKSDVWSLGVVLYELITLSKPFDANSQMGLVMKIVNEPPKAIDVDVKKCYSSSLIWLINGMLEKNPKRRLNVKQVLMSGVFGKKAQHVDKQKVKEGYIRKEKGKNCLNSNNVVNNVNKERIIKTKQVGGGGGQMVNKRVRCDPRNKTEVKLVSCFIYY